ncbi:uncharacterized protein LOC108667450 isoform X2 [Hyalella azteca]|uniref:Uncharacterized protein LOC108667450 isoform X2 n=1 Tax=Hyalella azteca TaxID=294128 RepID=A0A8B7N9E1_HYAAZ|nr:uncharacterized protein LOC108667450 isoform X2 [Hyalella azteca]
MKDSSGAPVMHSEQTLDVFCANQISSSSANISSKNHVNKRKLPSRKKPDDGHDYFSMYINLKPRMSLFEQFNPILPSEMFKNSPVKNPVNDFCGFPSSVESGSKIAKLRKAIFNEHELDDLCPTKPSHNCSTVARCKTKESQIQAAQSYQLVKQKYHYYENIYDSDLLSSDDDMPPLKKRTPVDINKALEGVISSFDDFLPSEMKNDTKKTTKYVVSQISVQCDSDYDKYYTDKSPEIFKQYPIVFKSVIPKKIAASAPKKRKKITKDKKHQNKMHKLHNRTLQNNDLRKIMLKQEAKESLLKAKLHDQAKGTSKVRRRSLMAVPRLVLKKLSSSDMNSAFAEAMSLSVKCSAELYLQLLALETAAWDRTKQFSSTYCSASSSIASQDSVVCASDNTHQMAPPFDQLTQGEVASESIVVASTSASNEPSSSNMHLTFNEVSCRLEDPLIIDSNNPIVIDIESSSSDMRSEYEDSSIGSHDALGTEKLLTKPKPLNYDPVLSLLNEPRSSKMSPFDVVIANSTISPIDLECKSKSSTETLLPPSERRNPPTVPLREILGSRSAEKLDSITEVTTWSEAPKLSGDHAASNVKSPNDSGSSSAGNYNFLSTEDTQLSSKLTLKIMKTSVLELSCHAMVSKREETESKAFNDSKPLTKSKMSFAEISKGPSMTNKSSEKSDSALEHSSENNAFLSEKGMKIFSSFPRAENSPESQRSNATLTTPATTTSLTSDAVQCANTTSVLTSKSPLLEPLDPKILCATAKLSREFPSQTASSHEASYTPDCYTASESCDDSLIDLESCNDPLIDQESSKDQRSPPESCSDPLVNSSCCTLSLSDSPSLGISTSMDKEPQLAESSTISSQNQGKSSDKPNSLNSSILTPIASLILPSSVVKSSLPPGASSIPSVHTYTNVSPVLTNVLVPFSSTKAQVSLPRTTCPVRSSLQSPNSATLFSGCDEINVPEEITLDSNDEDDEAQIISELIVRPRAPRAYRLTLLVPQTLGKKSMADVARSFSIFDKSSCNRSKLTLNNILKNCDKNGRIFLKRRERDPLTMDNEIQLIDYDSTVNNCHEEQRNCFNSSQISR